MINVPVVIKKSKIQGKGIFALRDIKRGEIVVKIGQKEIYYNKEEYKKFNKKRKKILDKFAYWDKEILVYPKDETKYLNHSCNPNVKNFGKVDKAIRNISAGEELTYDYNLFGNLDFKCNCGYCKI